MEIDLDALQQLPEAEGLANGGDYLDGSCTISCPQSCPVTCWVTN
ncbi:ALQxL family class IV lanthipeptide [Kitasatospora azatica]|nr:ALQxL family class IV lanthipeptide [Kitasatospora azatica]